MRLLALITVFASILGRATLGFAGDFFEIQYEGWLGFRHTAKWNHLNLEGSLVDAETGIGKLSFYESPLNLRFERDEVGQSAIVGFGTHLRLGKTKWHLWLDSGKVKYGPHIYYKPAVDCGGKEEDLAPSCGAMSNGQSLRDEARTHYFVRELYSEILLGDLDWLRFSLGKMLVSTGGGYLSDNFSLGARVTTDFDTGLGIPLALEIDGILPDSSFTNQGKRSPLVYVELDYVISFLESISVFFGWYRDGDNTIAEMVRSIQSHISPFPHPQL